MNEFNEPPLLITGPGDIVALMPHMIGARPDDSVVVFPVDVGALQRPVARVDIPPSPDEYRPMAQALAASFERFAGGEVVVLAFTDQLERAAAICEAVTEALEPATTVVDKIAAQGDSWLRLGDTRPEAINQGTVTQADRDRVAVTFMVLRGDRQPYDSINQMRESFGPTGENLSKAVTSAAELIELAGAWAPVMAAEQRWMTHKITGVVASSNPGPVAAADAAHLIGDVQNVLLRDYAMGLMTHEDAGAHAALWKDLLTRSPEHARTPVANLAAFGAWLRGDGMGARLALERVTDPTNRMARLIEAMVERGVDPRNWRPPEPAEPTEGPQRGDASGRHDPRREPPPAGGADRKGPAR